MVRLSEWATEPGGDVIGHTSRKIGIATRVSKIRGYNIVGECAPVLEAA